MRKGQFIRKINPMDNGEYSSLIRYRNYEQKYIDKYLNQFYSQRKWEGDLTPNDAYFMMRRFWEDGKIAAYRIKGAEILGLARFTVSSWGRLDEPLTVQLVNVRGVPNSVIPDREMTVGKDVVIGYYQRNKKPILPLVREYASLLSDIDNTIDVNRQLQKFPFLLVCTPENEKRLRNLIERVFQSDLALCLSADDKDCISSLNTGVPYVIDKLWQHKTDVENELRTYLGLENSGNFEKKERMISDEIDSQKAQIYNIGDNFDDCLDEFCNEVQEVLGFNIRQISRNATTSDAEDDDGDNKGEEEDRDEA